MIPRQIIHSANTAETSHETPPLFSYTFHKTILTSPLPFDSSPSIHEDSQLTVPSSIVDKYIFAARESAYSNTYQVPPTILFSSRVHFRSCCSRTNGHQDLPLKKNQNPRIFSFSIAGASRYRN